jgi:hypothetical protein
MPDEIEGLIGGKRLHERTCASGDRTDCNSPRKSFSDHEIAHMLEGQRQARPVLRGQADEEQPFGHVQMWACPQYPKRLLEKKASSWASHSVTNFRPASETGCNGKSILSPPWPFLFSTDPAVWQP